ncbi:MAG: type VI secretion system baseplate subunit TssG [Pyrinomonadaceae bacterium]
MAAEGGRADAPLARTLFDEAYRFEFFQAVRLLERMQPDKQPVGRTGTSPQKEVVRFRSRASLDFPPSELYEINRRNGTLDEDDESPPEMVVAFMGLTGPLGVLPSHYTEMVADRARYKDTALWEFLDLFNHRMLSLFYRAWEKYRFPVAYERGEGDRFTEYLFDVIGMGTRGLRGRLGLADDGLLLYGGLIAQRPHSASAVEAILGDRFSAPARIRQFAGQWLKIEEDSICRLGAANSQLGISTIVGARVWDDQSKFRVVFGPLTLKKFTALLPSGTDFRPATNLARFLAGMEFDFDMQLTLRADEVPDCRLTATGTTSPPMLGWTTWLKTREFTEDDSQVVLSVNA